MKSAREQDHGIERVIEFGGHPGTWTPGAPKFPMCASLIAIAWILKATAFSAEEAISYYWAGAGEDAATAGGGTWDRDESAVWRDSAPGGPLVKWTDHRAATFIGSSGGTVKVTASVIVGALRFTSTAGPFLFSCSGNIGFAGEGISNDSASEQAFNFEQTILTFSNAASAGAGVHGGRVSLRSDGLVNFTGTSTAGRATLVSRGEMHFANQSSAGESAITNTGILIFEDDSTSAAAAIANQGILNIEGSARSFAATAIANHTGGTLDLSSVNAEAMDFGALTNAAGGALIVGVKRLSVASLNLADGNDLNFDCDASACGVVHITTSFLGNAKAGGTRIAVNNAGGLAAGQSWTLLDWSGASSVLSAQIADFQLQPLAEGFAGALSIRDSRLILSVRASR